MGLDMYLYHIKKATDEDVAHVQGQKLSNIIDDYGVYFDDEPSLIEAIKPYLRQVTVRVTETDWDKLLTEHNIPLDVHLTGWSSGPEGRTYSLRDENDKLYHISLSHEEDERYDIEVDRDVYIAHESTQCGYWRKNYALSDELSSITHIENCGFYPVNEEMWDAIINLNNSDGLEIEDYIPISDDECLAYHEWY